MKKKKVDNKADQEGNAKEENSDGYKDKQNDFMEDRAEIHFITSRRKHPQTNGKTERWWGIFETEYDERFKSEGEFIDWYNEKRLSEAKDYQTPNQAYKMGL